MQSLGRTQYFERKTLCYSREILLVEGDQLIGPTRYTSRVSSDVE
jgi:hypothetical protein